MGADLYIDCIYNANHKKYEKKFDEAVVERSKYESKTKEYDEAHEKVSELYSKMYSKGYFRDSYNDSSLFWMLDLSWWDLSEKKILRYQMNVEKTKKLKELVTSREEILVSKLNGEDKDKIEYFMYRYRRLLKFLDEAIEAGGFTAST